MTERELEKEETPQKVRRTGCLSMCECVSVGMYECVREFSDLSVERLHVCLLRAIEGAWSHISGCHVLQRNAFNVSHSKGKAGTYVLKTQLLKSITPHKPL